MSRRYAIFNADDFGYSRGINRGILRAHESGVVTSTTFIVNGSAAAEAVRIARDLPTLSVGLHVNFTNEAQCFVDLEDPRAIRSELRAQFDRYRQLVGGLPTHLDSHQHVHRDRRVRPHFEELADEFRLPLRDRPPVVFKGGFYSQWEYGVPDRTKVSLQALERILRRELTEGIYEMSCHPGYVDPEFECVYHQDREWELETLCDPRLPGILEDAGISLIGYRELPAAAAHFVQTEAAHGR
ncbi:MAG TPA: ChbG/HpnK family deacetylase [Vicinamibacteria bacterium]